MIPLVPTIALAFFSFLCSAFVILRIVHSILPRRSLGRRVYPLTLSHTSSHSLPAADKGYVWLALCDISAVAVFAWEALSQWFHPRPSSETGTGTASSRVGSAARLWLALTSHQTCFLIISALILIHVHLRKSVSFGFAHWFLWAPLVTLATVTTTIAADIFADTSRKTLLVGYVVYASAIAVLNTIIFGSLVRSLVVVRRSLANFHNANEVANSSAESTEKQPQVILAPEDIDVIREGSSWITSPPSSHNNKSSARHPYSTTPTGTAASSESTSLRFPFWHSLGTRGTYPSTLPRTPSPCQSDMFAKEFGLLRPRTQSLRAAVATALTLSTLGSWLPPSLGTGTHPTHSARSYPTLHSGPRDRVRTVGESAIAASTPAQDLSLGRDARPVIAAPASVKVSASDQNQYAPSPPQAERGTAAAHSPQIEISALRILAWLAGVWVPLLLSLPYVIFSLDGSDLDLRRNDEFASTFLAVSVTISSPILVLNLLLRHPIPIPCDIFGAAPRDPDPRSMSMLRGAPSVAGSGSTLADSYRQGSAGTTGQGTPDARPIKDGAVDGGKGYRTRFPRVLAPAPRLSVFPLGDEKRHAAAFAPTPNWHYVQGAFPTQLPFPPAPTRVSSRGRSFRQHG